MCLYCQKLHNSVDILSKDVSVFKQSVKKSDFDKPEKIKECDKLENRINSLLEKIELYRSTQRSKHELDKGGTSELSMDIKEIQLLISAPFN